MAYNEKNRANESPLSADGRAMIAVTSMSMIDIAAIMEIEKYSQLEPWSKDAFLEELDKPFSCIYVARLSASHADSRLDEMRPVFGSSSSVHRPPRGILGYICFWSIADEVQILNLAVHRSYRRQGIARTLLLCALDTGCKRNGRIAVLEVRKSNLAAQSLYQSIGFGPVGERCGYYAVRKEPAVLMELEMNEPWKVHWLLKVVDTTKELFNG
ncbi:MAG: GNAT family N-acetyltransferase [Syntrophobacteraceae bacterium]